MAEAIVNARWGDQWHAVCAGTRPVGHVHPIAVRALDEFGIQFYGRSKSVEEFLRDSFDLVVTVCDGAAEVCHVWPGMGRRVHPGFPDPAKENGTDGDVLTAFRTVRDEIFNRVSAVLDRRD